MCDKRSCNRKADDNLLAFSVPQAIDQAPEDAQERAVYFCNAAACYLKKEMWQLAVDQCSQALKLNNSYLKVWSSCIDCME